MELITSWQIYWFTRLDIIRCMAFIFAFFGSIAVVIAGFVSAVTNNPSEEDDHIAATRIFKWSLPFFIFGIFTLSFVPSTKEVAAIWAIPKVINNPQVQSIGTNTLNIAEIGVQYLRDKIKDNLEK